MPNQGWEMSNQARKLLNQARKIPNQGRKLSNQGPGNQKWIAGSSLNRNWKDCGNRPLIRMINFDWESGNRLNFDQNDYYDWDSDRRKDKRPYYIRIRAF